jgi:hypothetical protein
LKPVDTRVESAWFPRLKVNNDMLLSNVAFNFNLRPLEYMAGRAFRPGRGFIENSHSIDVESTQQVRACV